MQLLDSLMRGPAGIVCAMNHPQSQGMFVGAEDESRYNLLARALRLEVQRLAPPEALGRVNSLLMMSGPLDLKSLGEAVAGIPAIAADALKFCNSPLFGSSQPVASIEQSVMMMDADIVRMLLLTSWLSRYTASRIPRRERNRFWQHSLLVAKLSRRVAEWTAEFQPELAFLAGLLHDLGAVPFLAVFAKELSISGPELFVQVADFPAAQRDRVGTDHCGVGLQAATAFGLPPAVMEVIGRHHQRGSLSTGSPFLCAVAAAETIALPLWGMPQSEESAAKATQLIRTALEGYLPALSDPIRRRLAEEFESDLLGVRNAAVAL